MVGTKPNIVYHKIQLNCELLQREHSRFCRATKTDANKTVIEALAAEIECQHELELLQLAEQVVRNRVQPQTWQAYQMTAREGCRAADVAPQVGMTVAEVYVAKSRVIKMLREEVKKLDLN